MLRRALYAAFVLVCLVGFVAAEQAKPRDAGADGKAQVTAPDSVTSGAEKATKAPAADKSQANADSRAVGESKDFEDNGPQK
jgi:hypothetical protein